MNLLFIEQVLINFMLFIPSIHNDLSVTVVSVRSIGAIMLTGRGGGGNNEKMVPRTALETVSVESTDTSRITGARFLLDTEKFIYFNISYSFGAHCHSYPMGTSCS